MGALHCFYLILHRNNYICCSKRCYFTQPLREHSNSDIKTIHNESYQMIFKRINESKTGSFSSKEQWVSGPQYHIDIYENIDSFQQQFPGYYQWYRLRPY